MLESEEHATARARQSGSIRGWGLSFGNRTEGEPTHGRAISRSIEQALANASLETDAVGHVNAHASGLVTDDGVEARAIHQVLGDVPVTAPKVSLEIWGPAAGQSKWSPACWPSARASSRHAQLLPTRSELPGEGGPRRADSRSASHGRDAESSQAGQAVAVALDAG